MPRPSKRALAAVRAFIHDGSTEPAIEVRTYRLVYGPGPVEPRPEPPVPRPVAPTFDAKVAALAADLAAVAERLGVPPQNVGLGDIEAHRAQRAVAEAAAEAEAARRKRATPAARERLEDDGWVPLARRVKR